MAITIAIVSGGGFQGGALIAALAPLKNFRIILLDSYPNTINVHAVDAFYVVPFIAQEAAFLDALNEIIEKEDVSVVIPSTPHELSLLACRREEFEKSGVKVAVCSSRLLEVLGDKKLLYHELAKLGLPTLTTFFGEPAEDAPFPLIGKPRHGWGAQGVKVADNLIEYRDFEAYSPDSHVWQVFLQKFDEFSFDFAIGFDDRLSTIVARNRIRTSSGFAVICESAFLPDAEDLVSSFAHWMKANGGLGLFNVQLLRDESGAFFFSDVNPRIGTSAVHGLGEGINLPKFVVDSAVPAAEASERSHPTVRKPVRMLRHMNDSFSPLLDAPDIRGVIFDLDDTLFDQKRWMVEKLKGTWNALRTELPDYQNFMVAALRLVEEGPRDRLLDKLIETLGLSKTIRSTLITTYRAYEPEGQFAYKDAARCISELRGLPLTLSILTDNPVASQKQKLATFAYTEDFDHILFSRELGAEKPNPELFTVAAERMQLPINKLAMVGDNLYRDILGALGAGLEHVFWLEREGTFFNFKESFLSELSDKNINKFHKISSLSALPSILFSNSD